MSSGLENCLARLLSAEYHFCFRRYLRRTHDEFTGRVSFGLNGQGIVKLRWIKMSLRANSRRTSSSSGAPTPQNAINHQPQVGRSHFELLRNYFVFMYASINHRADYSTLLPHSKPSFRLHSASVSSLTALAVTRSAPTATISPLQPHFDRAIMVLSNEP